MSLCQRMLHPVRACLYLRQASAVPFQTKDTCSSPTFLSSECPKPWWLKKNVGSNIKSNLAKTKTWVRTWCGDYCNSAMQQYASIALDKLQLRSKSLPSANCYLISQSRLLLPKMDTWRQTSKVWAEVDQNHLPLRTGVMTKSHFDRWQEHVSPSFKCTSARKYLM